MVASSHWLASQTGMAVLERGGNAFDAAVATAFVLSTVQPEQSTLGGEAPVIAHDAGSGTTFVVNGQGTAPAAASAELFASWGLDMVPFDGLLPACVPGMFGSLTLLLERHGTLRLRDVLDYAIGYAERGFPLSPLTAMSLRDAADRFRAQWPTSAATFLPGGRVPEAHEIVTNPALATTLRRILDEAEARGRDREGEIAAARDVFYRGFVAEAIDAFYREPAMDGTGTARPGLLRYEDLAGWEPLVEEPLTFDYHGLTVCKPRSWSQAPVLLQQLAILEGFDLADTRPASAELVHTVVESAKLAFADREAYYGDPAFADVPIEHLISREYADVRRKLITDEASGELLPGDVPGYAPRLPGYVHGRPGSELEQYAPLPIIVPGSGQTNGDTVHLDVADRHGNVVAITPSGGFLWGAPALPGLGFPVGVRGQMFCLDDGHPNALQPGKRPRTTLSPSLALRDGRPYMAFGTPGGDSQDQWPLVFLLNHVHFGMNLQEAIDSPSWHSTHFPSSFLTRASTPKGLHVESRVGRPVVDDLRRCGHLVTEEEPWSLSLVSAVTRDERGVLRGAASPRGLKAYAVGR
ncbi:MAG: gamma-glutamyltransferase [Pseudonocardia sp. SCN 72-86]|nr:MAG: gamma-glutamyltransferase [Pseudonocardia sp. SCN 72-86]